MRQLALITSMVLIVASNVARAQLDCTGGVCSEIKYGFGTDVNFRNGDIPIDRFKYDETDYGGPFDGISYYFNRAGANFSQECGEPGLFNPLPGQVRLREITACTPTSEGPKCVEGANQGKSCHLGANEPFASAECPGSTCAETAGTGCRVEIPISDGGKTNPAETSEYWITTLSGGGTQVYTVSALTGNTLGGTSAARECLGGINVRKACNVDGDCPGSSCGACYPAFIRQKPSMGWRYLLPEYRRTALGLAPGATYVRWDKGLPDPAPGTDPALDPRITQSTAFRLHQDDAAVCCVSSIPGLCESSSLPFATYPLLFRPTCTAPTATKTFINEDNIVPDWVFAGGRNSSFATDPNFEVPGQKYGLCQNNRDVPCSRGGSECVPFGDTCDFREPGIRIQVASNTIRDANSDPNWQACGGALAVIRGKPQQGCMQQPRYLVDGDPGPQCRVFNYGVDARYDANCDGALDVPNDKCPFLSEWNQAADSDEDCPADGSVDVDCRGDECECGDATLDGRVNVQDIVRTNTMIFGVVSGQLLADSNSDIQINVSDIVATNREIFVPDTSTCRHITSIRCGNNVVDSGEACDNGANCVGGSTPGALCDASGVNTCGTGTCQRLGGDGCNPACRVEPGYTCTGSPSVCTPVP